MDRLKELKHEIDHVTNALFECDIAPQNQEAKRLMDDAYIKVSAALDILQTERKALESK
jgi:hypothetical protein